MSPPTPSALAALAAALITDDGTARWTRPVARRRETPLDAPPAPARAAIRGATTAIDACAVARTGRRLSAPVFAEREDAMARLASHRAGGSTP